MASQGRATGSAGTHTGKLVLLVNPANSRDYGGSSAAYPNLGLLTLGTSLKNEMNRRKLPDKVTYYDGALLGNSAIKDYIKDNAQKIAILGVSSYTYNY